MLPVRTVMVFDVESIGLHGEGFAVAYVVVNTTDSTMTQTGMFACSPALAVGADSDRIWVQANVPPLASNCEHPKAVRAAFWAAWQSWRARGAWLAADCAWPVEAKFLLACVEDAGDATAWNGPYPLLDISSMVVLSGRDPRAHVERLPDELPAHNPLADARCSARQLIECLGHAINHVAP